MSHKIRKVPKTKPKRLKREKWEDVRPKLYKLFADAGIQGCELRYEGCMGSSPQYRSFAHSLRRRIIAKSEGREHALKMRTVIWACTLCHGILDSYEPEMTKAIVEGIIARRPVEVKHEL